MKTELVRAIKKNRIVNETRPYVYYLENYKIAKGKSEENSRKEYKLGKQFYNNDINVPETHGLVYVDSSTVAHRTDISNCFVITQKISGKLIINTSGAEREEAERQMKRELEKVLDLGWCAEEANWGSNSIFGQDEKLYLFDFEKWKKGTEEELNNFYNNTIKDLKIMYINDLMPELL